MSYSQHRLLSPGVPSEHRPSTGRFLARNRTGSSQPSDQGPASPLASPNGEQSTGCHDYFAGGSTGLSSRRSPGGIRTRVLPGENRVRSPLLHWTLFASSPVVTFAPAGIEPIRSCRRTDLWPCIATVRGAGIEPTRRPVGPSAFWLPALPANPRVRATSDPRELRNRTGGPLHAGIEPATDQIPRAGFGHPVRSPGRSSTLLSYSVHPEPCLSPGVTPGGFEPPPPPPSPRYPSTSGRCRYHLHRGPDGVPSTPRYRLVPFMLGAGCSCDVLTHT